MEQIRATMRIQNLASAKGMRRCLAICAIAFETPPAGGIAITQHRLEATTGTGKRNFGHETLPTSDTSCGKPTPCAEKDTTRFCDVQPASDVLKRAARFQIKVPWRDSWRRPCQSKPDKPRCAGLRHPRARARHPASIDRQCASCHPIRTAQVQAHPHHAGTFA